MDSKPKAPKVVANAYSNPAAPPMLESAQQRFADLIQGVGGKPGLIPQELPDYQRIGQFTEKMGMPEWEALYTANKSLDTAGATEAQGKQYFSDVVGGKYLDPNVGPLSQQIGSVKENVLEASRRNVGDIMGRTGAAGGSGGSREALMLGQASGDTGRALSTAIAELTGQNYARERGAQESAAAALPGFGERDTKREVQRLALAGIPRELAQQERTAQVQQEQEINRERFKPLEIAQNLFKMFLGQNTPVIQGQEAGGGAGGAVGGALSGAASGATAGSMLGPWGTVGGGLLGALMGGLSKS